MFMKRLAAAGAAALAGILAAGMSASASVSPFTYYTTVSGQQASGYFASDAGGFTHVEGWIGSNASTSLENLGAPAGGSNGAGYGLCDQDTGQAIQAGVIRASDPAQMEVAYGIGVHAPSGHSCFDGLVAAPVGLFGPVSISDTIDVQVLYDAHHNFANNGTSCHAGQALIEARDVTSDPGTWHKTGCIWVGSALQVSSLGKPSFDEADAGVVADTQHMSVPATNYLATFAHVGLTSAGGHHGVFQTDPVWTVFRVVGTTNGLASGTQLLVPQPFVHDHFDELSGTPSA